MNATILERLFNHCQSKTVEQSLDAIDDLGFLIERHVTNSYDRDSYAVLLNNKRYLDVMLDSASIDIIRYFLFFMIVNFRDRASRIAWCLGKLPNKEYSEGMFRCIDIFLRDQDDNTLLFLVKSICDEYGIQNTTQQIVDMLVVIASTGSELLDSSQFAKEKLDFYKENYQFLPRAITLPV